MQIVPSFKEKYSHLYDCGPVEFTKKNSKRLMVKEYSLIDSKDWEPVTIINPSLEHGPWIAGGAALKWYTRRAVGLSDIDVFFKSNSQLEQVLSFIKSSGRFFVRYESDNAITIDYRSLNDKEEYSWDIQLIKKRYYDDPEELIKSFDVTVSQIATDGKTWITGPKTKDHIKNKVLEFSHVQSNTARRLVKYWTYGYQPTSETINYVLNNSGENWKYSYEDDYDNKLI